MSKIYGYPELGRFGLGRSWIAYVRCYLWCTRQVVCMLGPMWSKPRLRPYMRSERDKSKYLSYLITKIMLLSQLGHAHYYQRLNIMQMGKSK